MLLTVSLTIVKDEKFNYSSVHLPKCDTSVKSFNYVQYNPKNNSDTNSSIYLFIFINSYN